MNKTDYSELDKILQSLLQINGSLRRLDLTTEEMYITLPKLDWMYIVKAAEQNKNSKFYKFYKKLDDSCFEVGGVKVKWK